MTSNTQTQEKYHRLKIPKMGLCCFKTAVAVGCRNIALKGVAY